MSYSPAILVQAAGFAIDRAFADFGYFGADFLVNEITPNFIEVMEMAPEGVALWDADDQLVMCNELFRKLHSHAAEIIMPGLKLEDLLLRHKASGLQIVRDGEPADWNEAALEARRRKTLHSVVVHYGNKWIQIRRNKLSDGSTLAFHTDITEIKKSEKRFYKIFQSSPALVSISTVQDAVILDVNEFWLKTLGYKKFEVIGRTPFELNLFEDFSTRDRVVERANEGAAGGVDVRYIKKNGDTSDFIISCEPIEYEGQDCYLFVAQDVSAAKRIEEEHRRHRDDLAHVTRVATMGEMATSLAHELNQPLAALSAYVNGSLRRLKPGDVIDSDIIEALEKSSAQADRAGEIIRRLRDFVAKNEPKFEVVDINDAVRTATKIMRSELNIGQIELVLDLTQSDVQVEGDPILIQQVIFNLLKNSADAVDGGNSSAGRVTVNTARDNGLVSFSIEDNGRGVAPGDQGQLFEPYFTTKEAGLGLGLPICRSIIENLNGKIWCEPDAAPGTKFRFQLPAAGVDGAN